MPYNIFVLGLDELNLETLRELPRASEYRFQPLLSRGELLYPDEIHISELVDKAEARLASLAGPVDAVVGYWDFPVSSMLPILCERFGLRGPSLDAVVKCEHKYWSRLEQQKVIDEYPRFALVDVDHPLAPAGLRYPMWLKPVKSFASELAFYVPGPEEFGGAVAAIREGVSRVGTAFDSVLDLLDLPPEVARAGGRACLAEEALHGMPVTVEGYSLEGEIRIYGVVDSIDYPDSPSFLRYQYPSMLPEPVIDRMIGVTERVVRQIGLDNGAFNVEFFWEVAGDSVSLLEINPRHSQSHARLFADVDGVPNHECMVSLALGQTPELSHRRGPYDIAAKWFMRRFVDGVVRREPTAEEIARVEREIPGVTVHVVAHEGVRLSRIPRQDSYSYELADIFIGADDEGELLAKYQRCAESLVFEFDDTEGAAV